MEFKAFSVKHEVKSAIRQNIKFIAFVNILSPLNSWITTLWLLKIKDLFEGNIIGGQAGLVNKILIILGLFLLTNISEFAQLLAVNRINNSLMINIRGKILKKLLKEESYVLRMGVNSTLSGYQNDIGGYINLVNLISYKLIKDAVSCLFLLGFLFYISTKLTVICVFIYTLVILPLLIFKNKVRSFSEKNLDLQNSSFKVLYEILYGIVIIKIYQLTGHFFEKYHNLNVKIARNATRALIMQKLLLLFNDLVFIIMFLVLLLIIIQENNPQKTLALYLPFSAALYKFSQNGKSFIESINSYNISITGAKRMVKLLNYNQCDKRADKEKIIISDFKGKIEFNNVYFSYNGNNEIFSNFNFTINKGEKLAIIGSSGVGKSTLCMLLMNLLSPVKGKIEIDGIDYRDIERESLMRMFSYVSQEPVLFTDTIYNNIHYGDLTRDDNEVRAAMTAAAIDRMAERLPMKHQSQINERGSNFSGGEKQRVTIARALLKEGRILIIDEGTSNLDYDTEDEVRNSILNARNDKTIIFITHRLHNLEYFSRVIKI